MSNSIRTAIAAAVASLGGLCCAADADSLPPELRAAIPALHSTNRLGFALNNGLAMTRGGRIWASWISGEDGSGAFTAASWSDDGGRTWTDTRMVIDGHDGRKPARTNIIGTFWLDPDGRLRCYTDHSVGHFDGRAGFWEAVCENPDAAEPKWSAFRRLGHGHVMNKPIVLSNGDWAMTSYLNGTWKGPGSRYGAYPELDAERGATCYVSSDRGRTWARRGTVLFPAASNGVKDWQESQLVELKDGTLRLFARVVDGDVGCLMAADSKDAGRTFGPPRRLKSMDNTNARFQIQRLRSGRLVFVKHGKPAEFSSIWQGRHRLTAYLSDDDGATWKGGLLLDAGCGSYPDLFQAPDGSICVSHDHGRYDTAEIWIHRFTEADILAGKVVSPGSRLRGLVMRAMDSPFNSRGSFRNPPPGYGEVPFWWWNGEKLDRERLKWQIEELHRAGVSGTQVNYCHLFANGWPTAPADPAIFSDGWWEIFGFAAEESAKRGMGIGLSCYTLDWPSRNGNLFKQLGITAPETRARTLGPVGGGRVAPAVRAGTLDPLNPESARRVIDRFFRPFWERVPASARGALNYFFQDELSLAGGWIWSDDFPEEFKRRKGYDVVPKLPLLFAKEATDEVMKTRLDYSDVMTELMGERYFKPIYDWHASRGLIYACDPSSRGHDPCEFGDYMKAIRWYTAPGYDVPWASADPVKGKMASSISHLYRRPRVWMEGYHSLGWQAAPEQLFASTAANYALGANLLNLHGLYYTTYGGWWEWAPPCYHFRQPYWKCFGAMLKYYERLSYALTRGVHVCDVAIVTPQAPLVADPARARKTSVPIAHRLVHRLANDSATDCDFIDAESLARATVEKDALGAALAVAGERYRVVLLPDMFAMREASKAKLAAFRSAGGRVIDVNDLEAVKTLKLPLLANPDVCAPAGVKVNHRHVPSVARPADAASSPRLDLYFFAGLPANAALDLRVTGMPFVLDPWTGERHLIECAPAVKSCETANGRTRLTVDGTSLAAGALLLAFEHAAGASPVGAAGRRSVDAASRRVASPLQKDAVGRSSTRRDAASTIALDGSWRVTCVPTLDNRWGDFRQPASREMIGPEVRRMHWVEQNLDQDLNFGPQFLSTTNSSTVLAPPATPPASKNKPPLSTSTSTSSLHDFSWRYGVFGKPANQNRHHGLNERVGDHFLIMGPYSPGEYYDMKPKPSEANLVSTFTTFVYAPSNLTARVICESECPYAICVAEKDRHSSPKLEELTVGGVACTGETVALKAGYTSVVARYRGCGRAAVVFVDGAAKGTTAAVDPGLGSRPPLSMRWFALPGRLSYDPFGGAMKKGTFTATVPPGTVDADVAVRGKLLRKEIRDGVLTVEVAFEPGFVGGNCFEREIRLKVGPAEAALGDWARWEGLRCYSGGMTYEKEFVFERRGGDAASTERDAVTDRSVSAKRVVLDLGQVGCCAEVRLNHGRPRVLVTSPWRLDVTDDLRDGKNRLSVTVYNTLNNHYQTVPTRYKVPTERCPSGLLGPVVLIEQ